MSLRTFLDEVLDFIESESLTDLEYSNLPAGLSQEYSKETYEALRGVVTSRDAVSDTYRRLASYFKAKGVDLSSTPARIPTSNILIGGVLE
jgi:hypothetical protein